MKLTRLFCGLLVLFCAGCPTVKRLGHFKVYEVSPRSEKQEFRLWTQFDLEAKSASIGTLVSLRSSYVRLRSPLPPSRRPDTS